MKTLVLTLSLLFSVASFADAQSRCDELNKALPGIQKIELDYGDGSSSKFLYDIKKIEDYRFEVVTKKTNGEVMFEAIEMILEVGFGSSEEEECFFYNPERRNKKVRMYVTELYVDFLKGEKIIEAEFVNAEGFKMFMSEKASK